MAKGREQALIEGRAARLLWDAKTAGELIVQFTTGQAMYDEPPVKMVRSAVERQVEVMGQALDDLAREFPPLAEQAPGIGAIVELRTFLAHRDETVRDDLIWQVTRKDVPGLVKTLTRLLAGAGPE